MYKCIEELRCSQITVFYQGVLSRDVDNTLPDDVHFNPVEPKINGRHKPNYTEQITPGNSCTCLLMLPSREQ